MSPLIDYLLAHAERGPCMCGLCIDAVTDPANKQPTGHTANVVFFGVRNNGGNADELRRLVREHHGVFMECDLFDGIEHSYIEIGAWLGDQGMALVLAGYGAVLGLWQLNTPYNILPGVDEATAIELARRGLVTIGPSVMQKITTAVAARNFLPTSKGTK